MSMSTEDKIKHYQRSIDRSLHDPKRLLHCINVLSSLPVTVHHLQITGVGRTVNALRKINDGVGEAAKDLVTKWKHMVANTDTSEEEDEACVPDVPECYESPEHNLEINEGQNVMDFQGYSTSNYHPEENNDEDIEDQIPRYTPSKISNHNTLRDNISSISNKYSNHKDKHRSPDNREHKKEKKKNKSEPSCSSRSDKKQSEDRKRRHSTSDSDVSDKKKSKSTDDEEDYDPEYVNNMVDNQEKEDNEEEQEIKCTLSSNSKETSHKSHGEKSKSKHHSKSKSHDFNDKSKNNSSSSKHSKSGDKYEHKSSKSSKSMQSSSSSKDRSKDKSESSKEKSSKDKNKKGEKDEKSKDSKKSKESSRHKSKKHKSDKEKKTEEKKKEVTEGGVDSSSGTSFADALGMCTMPLTKKKISKESSTPKIKSEQPSTSASTSNKYTPSKIKMSPPEETETFPLLSSTATLEPIKIKEEIDLAATLPEPCLNYKPLPHITPAQRRQDEDHMLAQVIYAKNQRTKVYSGNKSGYTNVPSLYDMCIRVLIENIDALEFTGGVPYYIIKPVLERATPDQLFILEHHNPYLIEDSDALWQFHCNKDFRTKKREEMESWREMYLRCLDEREAKLKALTQNIKQAADKCLPVRTTKLAYIDHVVKPPRNVLRKQAKFGTANATNKASDLKHKLLTDKGSAYSGASNGNKSSSPNSSSSTSNATSAPAERIVVPPPPAARIRPPSSSLKKPKAPLMAKALQAIKGRYKR